MSAPGPVPRLASRRRPVTVTVAASILVAMGLGGLVPGATGLVVAAQAGEQVRAAGRALGAAPGDVSVALLILWGSAVAAAVVAVVAAVVLTGLAIGNLRAAPIARVGTWVVCALGVLCGAAAFAVSVAQRAIVWRPPANPVRAELLGAISHAYPTWWLLLTAGLCVVQVLGYVVIALLLALPSAAVFFRRQARMA